MTKQQALDQLRLMQAWHEDFGNGPNADYDAICYAINIIEAQPAELETLINALEKEHQRLLEMQKAQPEIIRCKDCKHWRDRDVYSYCHYLYSCGVLDAYDYMSKEDDYCSRAERRTDG